MKNSESLVVGMALGVGMMYFLDRDRGARRRALVRDQVVHGGHELEDSTRAGARHVSNRARGLAHEARASITEDQVDDRTLEQRVRSEMGRDVSQPGRIHVEARDGRVTLSGTVPPTEVQDLVRTVKSVRGVDSVDNQLQVERPEDRG